MNNMDLLMGGLKLMVLGMGMVYVFLIVMIWSMDLMKKVLAPFAGMLEAPVAAPRKKAAPAGSGNDAELAAIAVAAVEMNRTK